MTDLLMHDSDERARHDPSSRFFAPVTGIWWVPLVTGAAWLIVSIAIFRFDYTTVSAVGALFGIVALAAAANEVLLATLATRGWRIAYLCLAALSFFAAVVSFIHPGDTFVALAALVSFYLIFRGAFDLVTAFSLTDSFRGWWLLAITAIGELLIGFWAAGSWNNSVVTLVAWVGATALTRGISEIVTAFQLRDVGLARSSGSY